MTLFDPLLSNLQPMMKLIKINESNIEKGKTSSQIKSNIVMREQGKTLNNGVVVKCTHTRVIVKELLSRLLNHTHTHTHVRESKCKR